MVFPLLFGVCFEFSSLVASPDALSLVVRCYFLYEFGIFGCVVFVSFVQYKGWITSKMIPIYLFSFADKKNMQGKIFLVFCASMNSWRLTMHTEVQQFSTTFGSTAPHISKVIHISSFFVFLVPKLNTNYVFLYLESNICNFFN